MDFLDKSIEHFLADGNYRLLSFDETLSTASKTFLSPGVEVIFVRGKENILHGMLLPVDCLIAAQRFPNANPELKDIMVPLKAIAETVTKVDECLNMMRKSGQSIVPVTKGKKLVATVREMDLRRKLNESLLETVALLEESGKQLKLRDEYLEIVAHDLRTPLSVITVCCDYIETLEAEKATFNDEYADFFNRMQRNAQKATDLVNDLLDLGKLRSGAKLNITQVSLPEYLPNIASNALYLAKGKEIEIVVDVKEPIVVAIDEKRFQQIIDNLLVNAIKFTPSKGKIYLTTRIVTRDGKEFAEISVRDTGMGIPKEKLDSLFRKYTQLDTGVARELGVGLGLSIALQFAQLHGAVIETRSEEGKGAEFSVLVPNPERAFHARTQTVKPHTRVLLVEDDEDILESICQTLEEEGCEVFTAKDGISGFDVFLKTHPDLVVSDIKMPGVDGIEFLQKIKSTSPHTSVILTSGYYPNIDAELARSVFKADTILTKPFTRSELVSLVSPFFKPKK